LDWQEQLKWWLILVVSQFKSPRASAIARRLKARLPLLGETLITTNRKGTWMLDLSGRGRR